MSPASNGKYFALWGVAKARRPDLERHALHKAAGLPSSHTAFSKDDLDEWIRVCEEIRDSGDFRAQIKQVDMAATRKRVYALQVSAALVPFAGAPTDAEQYAESVVARMQRNRRNTWTGGGSLVTLGTASEELLEKVIVSLKKEARRLWPRKEDLLAYVRSLACTETARAAVAVALCSGAGTEWWALTYEQLLVVAGVLQASPQHSAVSCSAPEPEAVEVEEPADLVDCPF